MFKLIECSSITDVDECASWPCLEFGSEGCVDLVDDYRCLCLPRYTGRNCQAGV